MGGGKINAQSGLAALRAVAEPTRLRILMLLATGELTVKDLTVILGQSQPRISRHLKLLHDAGLLFRFQEGSWVYFRLAEGTKRAAFAADLIASFDRTDPDFKRDCERATTMRKERAAKAQAFFATHAARWDQLRALHVDESEVESRIRELLGSQPIEQLIDLGTGTGRILEFLSDVYRRGIGIDTNQEMLAYARARLAGASTEHAQIRHGDICNLALQDQSADVVVMHQVLHFLAEPQTAISEAARLLEDGGRLLIIDFSPHQLDHLRDEFAHQRLGFSSSQMNQWFKQAGLKLDQHQELPPSLNADADSLTVSLWLARRQPAKGSRGVQRRRDLEVAQ